MNCREKYIQARAKQKVGEDEERDLRYEDGTYEISLRPDHFNYFSIRLTLGVESVSLPIRVIKELAEKMLEMIDGVEDPSTIMDDILTKKKELIKEYDD